MLEIYLARHGQDLDNAVGILNGQRDQPLSKIGLVQAQSLADEIARLNLPLDQIYTSPLKRAYRTAQIVATTLKMPEPTIIENLKERTFGIHDGMLQKDIPTVFGDNLIKTEHTNYILEPKGGETFPTLIERARKVLGEIWKRHPKGKVLVVAHGDIGKMMYASYYNLDWQEVLTLFHFGNSDLVLLSKNTDPKNAHVFRAKQVNHN